MKSSGGPGARYGPGVLGVVVAVVAFGLGACALAPGQGDGDEEPRERTELHVTNHNWSDMVVYVVRTGTRPVRLGMVTSMTSSAFTVPADFVGTGRDIHLVADPVGALESYTSEVIHVIPGDYIQWRLENRLPHSALSVF